MSKRIIIGACSAVALSAAVVAAQTSSQVPSQAPVQSGTQGASQQQTARQQPTQPERQVTVIGCVTREAGNEFTLTNATTSSTSVSAAAPGSGSAGATGTSGRTGATAAESPREDRSASAAGKDVESRGSSALSTTYSLTGDKEGDLEKYADQRVEIVGTIAGAAAVEPGPPADDRGRTPTTRPEGNAPAGTTPAGGAPAASQSAHMQRLTIVSFKPVPGGGC